MNNVVIFDMDGTILDTIDDILNAINYSLDKYNLKNITKEECKSFLGNGPKKLIERSLKDEQEYFDNVYNTYIDYYSDHNDILTKPYDGILELLERLKSEGYLLAVCSNKGNEDVVNLSNKYFKGIFDYIIGSSDLIAKKPSPDMVYKILNDLNVKDAIYVGDSEVDVKTAINANILGIFVLWGFRTLEILKDNGAKVLVKDSYELYRSIDSVCNKELNGI